MEGIGLMDKLVAGFYIFVFGLLFLLDHFRYAPTRKRGERRRRNGVNKHHDAVPEIVHVTHLED